MQPFTFIHAADLHLDSQFKGMKSMELDVNLRKRVVDATFTAFENLITLTIAEKADFLLIAGDIYDSEDKSLRARLKFRDGMRELQDAGIQVYLVHGNHDPLDSSSMVIEMPDNVHTFSGDTVETKVFAKSDTSCAAIHGISYTKREITANLAKKFKPLSKKQGKKDGHSQLDLVSENTTADKLFQIGLLHCSVGTSTEHETYAPCSLAEDLIPSGFDYWALGHVHTRKVLHEENPSVVYPGNIQGLHINETGERGCYVVNVNDSGKTTLSFAPLDDVRWFQEEITIDSLKTFDELEAVVGAALERCSKHAGERVANLRVKVSGRGELHQFITAKDNLPDMVERFSMLGKQYTPPVLINSLSIQTRLDIDKNVRKKAGDLTGDFLRIAEEAKTDPVLRQYLLEQLQELYLAPRAKKHLAPLNEAALTELIEEAESMCLDLLIGDNQ